MKKPTRPIKQSRTCTPQELAQVNGGRDYELIPGKLETPGATIDFSKMPAHLEVPNVA